jgi:hypothetical protein
MSDVARYMNRVIEELNQYLCKGCRDYGLFYSTLSDYKWERTKVAKSSDVYKKRVHNSRFTTVVGKQFAILDEKGKRVSMDNVPKEAVIYIDEHISQIKEVLGIIDSI